MTFRQGLTNSTYGSSHARSCACLVTWFCYQRICDVTHIIIFHDAKAADGLVTQGARASAAMVLTWFSWRILVASPEGLIYDSGKGTEIVRICKFPTDLQLDVVDFHWKILWTVFLGILLTFVNDTSTSVCHQTSNVRHTKSQNLGFSSRFAVVFAQSIEARC